MSTALKCRAMTAALEWRPDLKKLMELLKTELPAFAQPVFLRLSKESDTTSTFKFKKTNLVKAGYDRSNISEPLYYADSKSGQFKKLDKAAFKKINSGDIRL